MYLALEPIKIQLKIDSAIY